jgi:starch-binding outer membrane protein SusE/F
MKNIHKIFLTVLSLLFAWACAEHVEDVVISANPDAPTMTSPASGSTMVLTEENAGERLRFTFDPADFGYSAAVTYTLQMDAVGNDFENPADIASANATTIEVPQSELNQRLIGRGFSPDEEAEMEFRVRATVGPAVAAEYSEPVTVIVTPYLAALTYPRLGVPGDYQGWSPGNPNTIIYSVNADDVYEGFVHILGGSGEFKVIDGTEWGDPDFGDAGNGNLSEGGANLSISEPFGTFRLTINLNDMTYNIGTRRRWGIVGDATPGGWDTDTPMGFDADQNVLTITTDLAAGEFKFRADNNWDHNYGDDGGDGILNAGGPNIQIEEAGNYTITMDWKVPGEISYTVTKN